MEKNYEILKISFVNFDGEDILTMSNWNDNDAPDITDWELTGDWGE